MDNKQGRKEMRQQDKLQLTTTQLEDIHFRIMMVLEKEVALSPEASNGEEGRKLERLQRSIFRLVDKYTVEVDDDICDMSGGEPDYTGISFENSDQPLSQETKKALAEMNRTAR
jgi:hypothetical protein